MGARWIPECGLEGEAVIRASGGVGHESIGAPIPGAGDGASVARRVGLRRVGGRPWLVVSLVVAAVSLFAALAVGDLTASESFGGAAWGQGRIESPPGAFTQDPKIAGPSSFALDVSAADGEDSPRGVVTFRLTVWDSETRGIVYDSEPSRPRGAPPTRWARLTGGSFDIQQ